MLADVRAHAHAVRPHVQCRARQSRARAVRRLRPAAGALHRVLPVGLLRRRRAAGSPRSTTRSSPRHCSARRNRATCCSPTFIGGAGLFVGPILGAVLVTCLQIMLSDVTEAWLLYFGLMFIAMVMYAPGGLRRPRSMMHRPIGGPVRWRHCCAAYALTLLPAPCGGGSVLLVEMLHASSASRRREGTMMRHRRRQLRCHERLPWVRGARAARRWRPLARLAWPALPPPGTRSQASARKADRLARATGHSDERQRSSCARCTRASAPTEIIRGVDLDDRRAASATPSSARTARASRRCST